MDFLRKNGKSCLFGYLRGFLCTFGFSSENPVCKRPKLSLVSKKAPMSSISELGCGRKILRSDFSRTHLKFRHFGCFQLAVISWSLRLGRTQTLSGQNHFAVVVRCLFVQFCTKETLKKWLWWSVSDFSIINSKLIVQITHPLHWHKNQHLIVWIQVLVCCQVIFR